MAQQHAHSCRDGEGVRRRLRPEPSPLKLGLRLTKLLAPHPRGFGFRPVLRAIEDRSKSRATAHGSRNSWDRPRRSFSQFRMVVLPTGLVSVGFERPLMPHCARPKTHATAALRIIPLLDRVNSQAPALRDHLATVALERQQGFLDMHSQQPCASGGPRPPRILASGRRTATCLDKASALMCQVTVRCRPSVEVKTTR